MNNQNNDEFLLESLLCAPVPGGVPPYSVYCCRRPVQRRRKLRPPRMVRPPPLGEIDHVAQCRRVRRWALSLRWGWRCRGRRGRGTMGRGARRYFRGKRGRGISSRMTCGGEGNIVGRRNGDVYIITSMETTSSPSMLKHPSRASWRGRRGRLRRHEHSRRRHAVRWASVSISSHAAQRHMPQ